MRENKRTLWISVIMGLLSSLFLILYTPQIVRADSVSFTAEIDSDFSDVEFKFSFEDEDKNKEYIVHVYDEEGTEIKTLTLQKDSPKFLLGQSVVAGTYKIELTGENIVYAKSMSYKGTTPASMVTDTDINITSVISGLKAYFVDGDLVVEWDATNTKNINIKVTNPAKMQVLGNDKAAGDQASGGEYHLEIPDDVDEVEIYCVPSNESRIEGAGQTFVKSVVRTIPGDVKFPDMSVTNESVYEIKASAYDNLEIWYRVNDGETTRLPLEIGDNDVSIPIEDTMNNIFVYLVDEKGNRRSFKSTISRDTVAPTLTLSENYDGESVEAEAVAIRGFATNGAVSLVINNEPIPLNASGQFEGVVPLSYGENTIIIAAEDEAGNKSLMSCTITRIEKTFKIQSWMVYSAVGVIIVVIAYLFKKKKGFPPKDPDNKKSSSSKEKKKNKNNKEQVHTDKPSAEKREKKTLEKPRKKEHDKKEPKKKENKQRGKGLKKTSKESKPTSHKSGFGFRIGSLITPPFVFLFDILCVCVMIIGIRAVAIIPVTPISGSMHPLMIEGDRYYFNKLAYTITQPDRGDIVAFINPGDSVMSVKRVIGIAGDEISFADGYVFLNGKRLDESDYLDDAVETNCGETTFVVPDGAVFLMGDNREDSRDSRFWTEPYELIDNIVGKYIGASALNEIKDGGLKKIFG